MTIPNTPVMMYVDELAFNFASACQGHVDTAKAACAGAKPTVKAVQAADGSGMRRTASGGVVWRANGLNCDAAKDPKACRKARACLLVPKDRDRDFCCKDDTTGHHLIEVHCFSPKGMRGSPLQDLEGYDEGKAPTVCASESRADGSHGVMHAVQSQVEGHYARTGKELCSWVDPEKKGRENVSKWRYKHARDAGVSAHQIAFPHCDEDCIRDQLDAYHKGLGVREDTPVRTDPDAEDRSAGTLTRTQKAKLAKLPGG